MSIEKTGDEPADFSLDINALVSMQVFFLHTAEYSCDLLLAASYLIHVTTATQKEFTLDKDSQALHVSNARSRKIVFRSLETQTAVLHTCDEIARSCHLKVTLDLSKPCCNCVCCADMLKLAKRSVAGSPKHRLNSIFSANPNRQIRSQ